jgi:hypothetical protein
MRLLVTLSTSGNQLLMHVQYSLLQNRIEFLSKDKVRNKWLQGLLPYFG